MENKVIKLGGKVIVSDPCYEPDTWCQGVLENVLEGNWIPEVKYGTDPMDESKERPHMLIVHHEDFLDVEPTELCRDFEVGVDSGNAGIYDAFYFVDIKTNAQKAEWYKRVCNGVYKITENPNYKTLKMWLADEKGIGYFDFVDLPEERQDELEREYKSDESKASVMYFYSMPLFVVDDKGCCCGTAYGDGTYDCYVGRNEEGKIVSIMIDFINSRL